MDRFYKVHDIGQNHRMDIHGPGETDMKAIDIQTRLSVARNLERHAEASKRKEKSKSGQSKNRSLTMPENCEVSTSLIQQLSNSRKLEKMRGESWKFRCQQQCVARPEDESTGKPVALRVFARQNTRASLKPTNLRESVWKGLYIKIMKIPLQGTESIH